MSDNTNKSDVLMQPIVIPTIGDAGYADSLNEAFDTINKNFVKLSNHDFVKGDAGVSVKIADYKFFNKDGTLTVFGERLKEFIVNMSDRPDIEQADIKDANEEKVCGLFDYFDANPGSLKMICEWDETEVDPILSPVTSLYYVFMDGRYMGKALSEYERQYENTKDFSCILVYDVDRKTGEGKFSSLNNAFPTVYYEKGIGLCWKINGAGSGLPIRGIPGKDGANATLYIVKSTNIEDSIEPGKPTKGVVDGIYESYEGYIPVEDIEDITLLDNQAALILGPKENSADNTFYFGTLALEEVTTENVDEEGNVTTSTTQVLYAYCSSDTSITTGLDNEAFINSMKRIDLLNNGTDLSSGIKGLFIPLQSPTADNKQKVHLLTASSITNTEGISNDLKSDILWTPVADINSLEVNSEKSLEIDKYLYVKVNQDYDTVVKFVDPNNNAMGNNPLISGTNYVLKYKLDNILSGGPERNSHYFAEYSLVKNGQGSRYYGDYYDKNGNKKADLSESNTVVLTDKNTESTNHFDSMPEEFKSRLNSNAGIYRWVLCDEVHANWDVDELLDTITGNIDDAKTYDFDKRFNVVFTTDLTPGEGTQIMWFDGTSIEISERPPSKFIVPGWITNKKLQTSDEGDATDFIFKFIKFVPIYNIDSNTQIDTDTALNINYNVNITGDNNNSKRSLSVHGDINCDTISVYKLTATGEIDNIYTRNNIIGDAGIKLAKNTDKETINKYSHLFNVDGGSGDVTTDGHINAKNIISSETKVVAPIIESPSIINITEDATGNITSNMYKLLGNTHREDLEYDNTKLVATVESYPQPDHTIDTNKMYRDRLKIDLVDTGIIDIKKRDLQLDRSNFDRDGNGLNQNEFPAPGQVSKLMTNMPIISHGKGSIVITDDVPSNVFVADAHTAAIHEAFQSFADIDAEEYPISGEMVNKLFDKPNSYIVNKQIVYKKHDNTDVVSKIVDFKDRSATIKDSHAYNDAQYESICYYNPSPSTSYSKYFTYDSNSIITEINITPSAGSNIELDATERITITLPKLKFGFGLYAHCSNGKWTMLKNASMTLKYKIQSINTTTNAVSSIADNVTVDTYSFPDSNKYWTGGVAKYTQKGGNVANNNYETWRFKAYEFNPKDITISASNMSKIKSAFDKKETIQIIFWPEFNVSVTSEGGKKKLADDIMILRLRPIGNSSKSGSITTSSSYVSTINLSDAYTRCYYRENTVGMASDKDTSTNILCTDGLIVDANNYVFGLGLGMYGSGKGQHLEPELYFGYHDTTNNNAYKEQCISLNDLFRLLEKLKNLQ